MTPRTPQPGDPDNFLAMLAHLSAFYAPVVGPIVLYLWKKDTSPFVAFHALQSLMFHFVIIVAYAIFIPLCFILIGIPFVIAIGLVHLVLPIVAGLKSLNGEWYCLPIAGSIANNAVR